MQNKYKFQFIDLLILLLIGALLFGFVYYFVFQNEAQRTAPSVTYTLAFEGISAQVAKKPKVNDIIYDAQSGLSIGTVQKIEITPATYSVVQGDTAVSLPHPTQVTLILTLTSNEITTDPLALNGTVVRIGRTYAIRSLHFTGDGTCTALTQHQN